MLDRVREALFSILGSVEGATVLDLYSGTGSIGIEALSRGAVRATFVEAGKPALAVLRDNLAKLGLEECTTVLPMRVEQAARRIAQGELLYDLVLADPPYAAVRDGTAARAMAKVLASGRIASGARIVVEHPSTEPPPELPGAELEETRKYGDTAISFYVMA
mgnify:CR=1 FL=1